MTSQALSGATCRIAIVHDWLTGMRGGEKVLEALCERYPQADVFTLVHVPGTVSPAIERVRPVRSPVGWLPGVRHFYRYCLPLFPAAIETFDLDHYDLVISTSHCAAKSAVATGRARHLCYCFTPMRYAWDQFEAYFGRRRIGAWSAPMQATLRRLARWDAATSARPDRYVSISQYVAGRIRRYYNRRSAIVHPPVDTEFFCPSDTPPPSFALVVSALVPYKRIDLAMDACRLAGVPLVVVGDGPDRGRLEAAAAGQVDFRGTVSNEAVRDLYRRAQVVLMPGVEDFGLVPVEAQACGRPVIALRRGGAQETIVDGVTGLLVDDPTPVAFAAALRHVAAHAFDPAAARRHAERFSKSVFLDAIARQIDDLLQAPAGAVRW
jgi:glycosyltransferase involved in cell wall biosynthesis